MTRNGRGAVALITAITALSVPGVAGAEIARPPGANPSGRGFELVSLPDTKGIPMFFGTALNQQTTMRPPSLATTGGRAFVSTALPIDGQPDSGGASDFRSTRTPSGAWTQDSANLPQRSHQYVDFASPANWTPDFSTLLWATSNKAVDAADPSPIDTPGSLAGLLLQPLGGESREQLNGGTYSVDPDNVYQPVVSALTGDGHTVTFSKPGASFAAGTPQSSVYQRTDTGPIQLVSRGANGTPLRNATFERASADGSTLVMSGDAAPGTGRRLYLRSGGTTTVVDRGRPEPAAPRTNTRFVGATPDLSTIYFVTRDRLLAADTDADGDIYRWTKTGSGGDLELVSRGTGAGGNGSGAACPSTLPTTQVGDIVQGCDVAFVGASGNGQTVYFLSPERLDGAAGATPGSANLYERRGNGPIRFVLTTDNTDGVTLNRSNTFAFAGDFTVEGDGSLLVRTSINPATGTAFTKTQIVRVDPQTAAPTCISCTADGGSTSEAQLASLYNQQAAQPQTNATADGQHVFFDTPARLVPEDRNSGVDVYDYDVATGTRSLVSSAGGGVTGSYFAGVSDDGADVLIATTDTLVGRDRNGPVLKVYDSRRGGGEEAPTTAPVTSCGDDGCKPAATAAPIFGAPESGLPGASRGNVASTPAVRLTVGGVSASQRRAFAKTGRLTLKVRTSAAASVRLRARAKVGRSTATVASGSTRLRRAGTARATLRLSEAARRELRRKGSLRVTITVSVSGSAPKTLTLSLRAATDKKAGAR